MDAEQFRAARGILGISRQELAKLAKVSADTIRNCEEAIYRPQQLTQLALMKIFEERGISFFQLPGGINGIVWTHDTVAIQDNSV